MGKSVVISPIVQTWAPGTHLNITGWTNHRAAEPNQLIREQNSIMFRWIPGAQVCTMGDGTTLFLFIKPQLTKIWVNITMFQNFARPSGDLVVPSFKFQVSRMSETSSKTPLSTISRLDLWWTCRFLMHILQIFYVLVVPSFKFQVSSMSGTSSKTPPSTISRLDPWRTCRFLTNFLQIVYDLVVPSFKFQVSRMSGT